MATLVDDSFTDTNGTELTAHTPEVGGPVTKSGTGGGGTVSIVTNRAWGPSGTTGLYYYAATPPSADYVVKPTWGFLTDNNGSTNGVGGRVSTSANTGYFVRATCVTDVLELFKLVAGTFTSLGTAAGLPADNSVSELRMAGDQISVWHNGSLVIGPVTDTSISDAGRVAVRSGGAQTSLTGIHIAGLTATYADAAPDATAPLGTFAPQLVSEAWF